MSDTNLVLSGVGVAPFSARDLTESINPIDSGALRRTINAELRDLTLAAFRKYRVSISAQDVQPPAFDGIARGQEVTVDCTSEWGKKLTLTAGAGSVVINRQPVTGSGRAMYRSGSTVKTTTGVTFSQNTAGVWTAAVNFSDGTLAGEAFVFYRPKLICLVSEFSGDSPEWQASPGWSLTLEEK